MSWPQADARGAPVVWVTYEGPGPQRRLSVAFRVILAIPHFVYAALVSFVAFLAVVAGWFAALVLGRLPYGLAEFLARVVDYVTRVNAYGYLLLTDRYPPFRLGAADYAVSVDVPPDVQLNRAAVLFRLVLMIPAGIVIQFLSNGLTVVVFIAWLLALMLGRLPVPLFEAFAAALRYQVRFYAYAAMLTSEYPRGLFGDPADELATGPGAPPPGAFDESGPWTEHDLGLSPTPRITTLVLSNAAKWILGLVLAFGAVFTIGTNIALNTGGEDETAERLEESYHTLEEETREYGRQTQRCAVSGGLECLHSANRELAEAVREFQTDLGSLEFSDLAIDQAEEVDAASTSLIQTLERMASTTDAAEYDRQLVEFQSDAGDLDEEVQDLLEAVRFSQ